MHVCVRRGALYLRTRQAYLDDIQMRYVKSPEPGLPYPKQFCDTGGLQAFTHMGEAWGEIQQFYAKGLKFLIQNCAVFLNPMDLHATMISEGGFAPSELVMI